MTALWLSNTELAGGIPPELGQLSSLEELRLNSNQLTGHIPEELGQLRKLTYLWLGHNRLSGDIPPELGMLSSLQSLELHENQLSGPIPAAFGRLSNLRELDLHNNQLTGEIPPELEPLRNLFTLDLRNNSLSGSIPTEYAERRYGSFGFVYLSGNELTGCIPLELGQSLGDRHELGLSYCQCPASWERPYGAEPRVTFGADGIPYMPHQPATERAGTYRITFSLVLDLPPGGDFSLGEKRRNDAGRIVVDIDEEKSRSSLTIDPFTGEELGRTVVEGPAGCDTTISALFDHVVSSARAKPLEIPAQPNGLQAMYRLQPVAGPGTYYLGYTDYLVVDVPAGMTLTLEDAGFLCTNPGGCFGRVRLWDEESGSYLSIASTGEVLSRTIVEEPADRDVDGLFDRIVASLRRVPPPYEEASCDAPPTADDCVVLVEARDILAADGTLNWELDTSIWHWDGVGVDPWTGRVVELELSRHELSGRIPPVLGQLSALEVLKLYDNNLRGRIPPELGRLVNLRELYLGWNPLGGEIPPELGSLTNLVELSLLNGELTGGIPPELGRLVNLRELRIWSNPLGGEIPPELGSLTNLVELSLHTVGLVGAIPDELGSLERLEKLNLYGNYLEGCIPDALRGFDFIMHGHSNPDLRWCAETTE